MKTIITHTSPDFDAIGAAWMLQRFADNAATVEFRPANTPAADLPADAVVVDMAGGAYDHHQLAVPNATCATRLVFEALADGDTFTFYGVSLARVEAAVDLIHRGDTGRLTPAERDGGVHAALSSFKANCRDDAAIYAFGATLLDAVMAEMMETWLIAEAVAAVVARAPYAGLIAERQARQAEAAAELERYVVYRSNDGLFVALNGATKGHTTAAWEAGAAVVLFHTPLPTTVVVGVQRNPEFDGVDLGRLVGLALDGLAPSGDPLRREPYVEAENAALAAELRTWYRHNAGFYAGRGTPVAPDPRPVEVSLRQVAQHLDWAWER